MGEVAKYGRGKALLLWIGLLTSDTAAQIMIKIGSVQSHESRRLSLWIMLGYALLAVSFALWMQIIRVSRLSISLSATSLLYVTIPITSHFLLKEPLTPSLLAGALLIAIGVFILGVNEPEF